MKQLAAITTLAMILGAPARALACAACFGKSDSAMAQGMNAGIFSLMAVIVTVLIGAASFFIYLARKAAMTSQAEQAKNLPAQSQA